MRLDRTYSELILIPTFLERYRYLSLRGNVGEATFGSERWMNQDFYRSREWKQLRMEIIARDEGCDLAFPDHEIFDRIHIHHLNPMSSDDIRHKDDGNLDPENLICVTQRTHNAIHYGDESQLPRELVERRPDDTIPWM